MMVTRAEIMACAEADLKRPSLGIRFVGEAGKEFLVRLGNAVNHLALRHRRPDLDSPWWWAGAMFVAMAYVAVLAIWLVWAFIALPIAGIAKLCHNDDLADKMVR
jgi:hypothetical protein